MRHLLRRPFEGVPNKALWSLVIAVVAFCATSLSTTAATEPADAAAATEKPREFEIQLVGPDGKPVPSAEFELRNKPAPTREQVRRGELVKATNYGATLKTDAEGKVSLELPKISKYFTLNIQVPGFGPYWAAWESEGHSEDLPEKFVAELEAGWCVGGIVVDPEGKPVKGAKVRPSFPYKKRPGDENQLYVGTDIKTGDDGKWHFDCVPVSLKEVPMSITHPELMPERMGLNRTEFGIEKNGEPTAKITMKAGIVISGLVTDETGKPIAGALIRTREREAKTGEDGKYELKGCGPGALRIVASSKGRAMDMQDIRVEPDMPPVDFAMKPGGKIRVRVVDKAGKPIAKSRVFFQEWRGRIQYFEFDKVNQYADKDGVWEWDEAPLDSLKVDICPPEGRQLVSQSIGPREEEYVFQPLKELVITGTVTDAKTKEPIKSFRVIPGQRFNGQSVFWNRQGGYGAKDGKYELRRNRTDGDLAIRIEANGYKPADSEDIKSAEENVTLDFQLEPGVDIDGTILTPDGKPAAGAKLAIGIPGSQISIRNGDLGDSSTYAARVETDAAGKFHFPPQPAAFTLVATHASGYASIQSNGEWKGEPIKLKPWSRVEGTFRIGKNAGGNITLEIMENGFNRFQQEGPHIFSSHEVTADSAGHFTFERIMPGKAYLGRRMIFMMNEGATEVTSSKRIPIECKEGETLKVELGGDGRQVIGQLAPPKGANGKIKWSLARISLDPELSQPLPPKVPAAVQNDKAKYQAWANEWRLSNEGQAWQAIIEANNRVRETSPTFNASADTQGNFTIDDVPPGNYLLRVWFDQQRGPGAQTTHHCVVPRADGDQAEAAIDLGVLTEE